MPRTVVVVRPRESAYPDPVRVRKGEEVAVGSRDPDFPGWIRVMDRGGRKGWAPEAIVEQTGDGRARAKEDYDATELDVSPGMRLIVHRETAGWMWACDENGFFGWVPVDCTRETGP